MIGTRKLVIGPNSRLVLDAPASQAEDYPVSIHFTPPGQGRAEPLCETNWTHQPKSRSVYFILNARGNPIPRVMGFPDFRTGDKKNKKP
jgi:hypothetical protein